MFNHVCYIMVKKFVIFFITFCSFISCTFCLQIAEFFILNYVFYVLSKPWNRTQLFRNSFDSKLNYQNYRHDISVRDISYSLEEYYDAKTVARELQQLNRDSRNIMHVSKLFLLSEKNHFSLKFTHHYSLRM